MKQPNIIWLGAWLFLAIGTFATATKLHTANQRIDNLLEEREELIKELEACRQSEEAYFIQLTNERIEDYASEQ